MESPDLTTLKSFLIKRLKAAIEYHNLSEFNKISSGYEEYDRLLPRGQDFSVNFYIALTFWDSWIDASNHEFQYYPGILKDDWPKMAVEIIESIEHNKNIEKLVILKNFDLRKKKA